MPNPGSQACAVCHTAINGTFASYATLASIAVLHTGITGSCAQCHGGPGAPLTFYNNNDNPKAAVLTPPHIPYLNGSDCSACHAANYVTGGFGPIEHERGQACVRADDLRYLPRGGPVLYIGASTPALQGRPATHVSAPNPPGQATGDCSLCHETTDWSAPITLPNGHMPIPGTQTCAICHIGNLTTTASYATLASIPVLHTGITSGLRAMPRRRDAADVLQQQRQSEGRGLAVAGAYSGVQRRGLQLLPCSRTTSPAASDP